MSREEHNEFMGGNEVHLKGIRSSPLPLKKMVEPWTAESNDVDINALRSALDLKVPPFSSFYGNHYEFLTFFLFLPIFSFSLRMMSTTRSPNRQIKIPDNFSGYTYTKETKN